MEEKERGVSDLSGTGDDVLYRSFLNGRTDAFDELMRRYDNSLMWYLYGILHDYQDAEDMTIESFARILVKRPSIGEGCVKAYLFRVGRNLAIRYRKKNHRTDEFSLDGLEMELPADGSVETEAELDEKKDILYRCLGRIDQELREVLYLVYLDGLSYAQAADVMHVNTKRIDHLLERGRKQMRKELAAEGITDP